jgi:DNA repair protein RadC
LFFNIEGQGQTHMNLFLNNLAEIKISYSSKVPAKDRHKVTCSRDASEILRLAFENIEYRESFYILLLNRANQVLGYNMISLGGISGTITDIRMIFQVALKSSSSAIILAHNHPSGNLNPSEADKKITQKVKEAGILLDISVLDHIILTQDSYFSFADENLL